MTVGKLSYVLIAFFLFGGTFFMLASLVSTQPFGHDEAVYITKARSWMSNLPADQFGLYRPIGMAVVAWGMLHISDTEKSMRMFGVFMGAVTTLAIFLLFGRVFNEWIAIAVSTIIVSSPLFLRESTQFFNDVPSSGALFLILLCLYISYERFGKSNFLYAAVFLSALAFYIRYGVILSLGVIGGVTIIFFVMKSGMFEDEDYSKLKRALTMLFLLFLPHFLYSYFMTRSIIGIIMLGGSAAHRAYFGEGLVTYIKWLPHDIGGWVLGIATMLGIFCTLFLAVIFRKKMYQQYLNMLWLGLIGLGSFIVIGLLVHAEARYVFFPVVLLTGVGVAGIYFVANMWSHIFARVLMVGIVILSCAFGFFQYREVHAYFNDRELNVSTKAYEQALAAIRRDESDPDGCALWLVLFRPTASWYTGCSIATVTDTSKFIRDSRINARKTYYSLVYTKLKEAQITEGSADAFGVSLTEIFRVKDLSRGDLVVYRMEKKSIPAGEGVVAGAEFNSHTEEGYINSEEYISPAEEEER